MTIHNTVKLVRYYLIHLSTLFYVTISVFNLKVIQFTFFATIILRAAASFDKNIIIGAGKKPDCDNMIKFTPYMSTLSKVFPRTLCLMIRQTGIILVFFIIKELKGPL